MRVVAVTGGIACGKTTLLAALRQKGAQVIDADQISRFLTSDGGMALPPIRDAFGDAVFTPCGALDRAKLGECIFSDSQKRETLNAILHPMIRSEIARRLSLFRQADEKLVFLDIPLLYEAHMESLCDEVWCVYLPYQAQLKRLMARNRLTQAQARKRIESQMPLERKKALADFVIDTSGTPQQSAQKALTRYESILKEL